MQIPRWIWKTNEIGTGALVNLTCVGVCATILLTMFKWRDTPISHEPEWKQAVFSVSWVMFGVFTFPVGWVGACLNDPGIPPFMLIPFVILNAYAWGYLYQRDRLIARVFPRDRRAEEPDPKPEDSGPGNSA